MKKTEKISEETKKSLTKAEKDLKEGKAHAPESVKREFRFAS